MTREEITNECAPGWSVFSVGVTGDFRILRADHAENLFRVQQLLITTAGDERVAEWATIASATSVTEALDTMHADQMKYVKELRKRRGR